MTQPTPDPMTGVPTNRPNPEPTGWVQPDGTFPHQQMAPYAAAPTPQAEGALLIEMGHTYARTAALQYRPHLVVDGINHPVDWGTNRVVLPAGRHSVQTGIAGSQTLSQPLVVDVAPGMQLPVFSLAGTAFRHPTVSLQPFSAGQRRAGVGLATCIGVVGILFILGLAGMLLFAAL